MPRRRWRGDLSLAALRTERVCRGTVSTVATTQTAPVSRWATLREKEARQLLSTHPQYTAFHNRSKSCSHASRDSRLTLSWMSLLFVRGNRSAVISKIRE
jgi:hypothetical protein